MDYVCAALSLNEATKPNRVGTEWRREWREIFRPSSTLHGRYSYLFNDWSDGGDSTAVRKRLLLGNGLCVCRAKSGWGNRTKSSLDRMTSWMTRKNRPLQHFNGRYLFNDWSDGGDSTAVRKRLLSTLTLYYALCTLDKDCGNFDWLNGKVLISLF